MVRSLAILAAVFVLGVVAGGAVVYATHAGSPGPTTITHVTNLDIEGRADKLTKRLGLRPDQRARLVEVLRAHRTRAVAARGEMLEAVRQILDEDQRRRFSAILREPGAS